MSEKKHSPAFNIAVKEYNAGRWNKAMLKILVKLMGITYVAEFASGICKDAGFSAIGSQIEMFAKFSIMAVSVPVLLTLLETIEGLLGA